MICPNCVRAVSAEQNLMYRIFALCSCKNCITQLINQFDDFSKRKSQTRLPRPQSRDAALPLSAGTVLLLPNQSYITLVSLPA